MIKAIFWDNDGVLVDTEGLYYKATKKVLKASGVNLSKSAYIDLCLNEGKSAFELARAKGLTRLEIDVLRQKRNTLYGSLLSQGVTLNPGVREVVQTLRKKFLMGIVTSSQRTHFDIIHRNTKLLNNFDFIFTREDYHHAKPHPEPYMLALERSGFLPQECVVIEDSLRGLESARKAKIGCYIIPNTLTKREDFRAAKKVLRNVRALIKEIGS